MDDQEAVRRLEDEKREAENTLLNWAAETGDMRMFNYMRANIRKIVARPDLPRDLMTAADYCRARKLDRDVLGRRIK
jgi:hypothetical protein